MKDILGWCKHQAIFAELIRCGVCGMLGCVGYVRTPSIAFYWMLVVYATFSQVPVMLVGLFLLLGSTPAQLYVKSVS